MSEFAVAHPFALQVSSVEEYRKRKVALISGAKQLFLEASCRVRVLTGVVYRDYWPGRLIFVRSTFVLCCGVLIQSYRTELLLEKGYEVHGIIRRSSSFNTGRLHHLYEDQHERTWL